MRMEKALTVSVAAYNVEPYLRQTLDSLAIPEIVDDLEIFVIDDGGTDRSLEIAREYAARYPQSFHAVHKENGGYGTTVNYSVAHATGKYFKLLDGDDWADREGLVRLVRRLKQMDTDVVITHMRQGSDAQSMAFRGNTSLPVDRELKLAELREQGIFDMWEVTYRTEILRRSGLELPGRMLYTDRLYVTLPLALAKTVRLLDIPVYCYRIGREEQSVSRKQRIKHANMTVEIGGMLNRFYEEMVRQGNENCAFLQKRIARHDFIVLKTLLILPVTRENRRTLKEFDQSLLRISPEMYADAIGDGTVATFMKILRATNYHAYWLMKFMPNRIASWKY